MGYSLNALHSFAHADGNYHLMGCMLSAAPRNKWWMEEILKTKDFVKEQSDDNLGRTMFSFAVSVKAFLQRPLMPQAFIGMRMDTKREMRHLLYLKVLPLL